MTCRRGEAARSMRGIFGHDLNAQEIGLRTRRRRVREEEALARSNLDLQWLIIPKECLAADHLGEVIVMTQHPG